MSFTRYVTQPKPRIDGVPVSPAPVAPSVPKVPSVPSVPSNNMTLGQAEFGIGGTAAGRGAQQTIQGGYTDAMNQRALDAAIDAGALQNYRPLRNTIKVNNSNINLDNSVEQIAADILAAFQTENDVVPTGSGGGVDNTATINALRQMVANAGAGDIDYGALAQAATERYGGYGATLDEMLAEASGRMTSAADTARTNIGNLTPSTVYDPVMASMGLGSGAGYLASIGASDADVRAVRDFEDRMLADRLARTTGYSQRVADVEAANRAAREAGIETIAQSGATALSGMEAYNRAAIANALAAEQERLLELERRQTQAREQAILEARMAAAQLGATI